MVPSIRRSVVIGFGLAVGLLLIASLTAAANMALLLRQSGVQEQSREAVRAADALLVDLLNAETGQRGYLLTGEPRYLEPYRVAEARLSERRRDLRAALSGDEERQQEIAAIDDLIERKLAELRATIELRERQGPDAAIGLVTTHEGKQLMDAIRSQLDALVAADYAEVQRGGAAVRRTTEAALAILIGSMGLMCLVGWAALRNVTRALDIRAEAESLLRASRDTLEREVQVRTADLRAANAALAAGEARYRGIVEDQTEYICRCGRDGAILFSNTAYARSRGAEAEALIGVSIFDTFPSAERARIASGLAALSPLRPIFSVEYPGRAPDGRVRWEAWTYRLLTDDGGEAAEVQAVGRDVTERKQVEQEHERQLRLLETLRAIDLAILGNSGLEHTLETVLAEAASILDVDAIAILQLDPQTQLLSYLAGRGFSTDAITRTRLHVATSVAGRAVGGMQTIGLSNLAPEQAFVRADLLAQEGFVRYYAAPLITGRHTQGVIEVFLRTTGEPTPAWLSTFEAIAGQTAIAIDNCDLLEGLERANQELEHAYNATLEGWSRALELRDDETQGHSARVTTKTVELARVLGLSEAEIVQVERGALLHDIGKIGIPDAILLKPGRLDPGELEVMQQHPQLAHDLLERIAFLQPALDIPYYHHERWDGSGYPQGLKGEEIPLYARIFAVVDVWDALRSDRPYRRGWPEERIRAYLREYAGVHFDPAVVEAFLRLLER